MNSGSSTLNRFAHSIGQNWYHIVLIPKGRYPIFQQQHQRQLMLQAIDWICNRHNMNLFEKEVMDDHVHLFVDCPPDYSLRKMVHIIKGGTSYYVRQKHPSLKQYPALWSKGFMYRSVGAVNADVIKRYINDSNHWLPPGQKKLN